jgi:hypothetical protein
VAGRLNRFLNLEQEHPPREGSRPDVSARFGPQQAPSPADPAGPGAPEAAQTRHAAGAQPDAPAAPAVAAVPYDPEAEAATASLRARRAALTESGIALDPQDEEQQTFLRCGVCEADNFRHAVKCQSCNSRLDTDEQRLFNRGFWARRRAEDAAARQAEEARRQAAASPQDDLREGARADAIGPVLARAVAAREGQRLAWMDPDRGAGGVRSSVGMELLGKVQDPATRQGVMLGLAAAWLALGARGLFPEEGASNPVSLVVFFAAALLFLPRGRRL